MAQRYNKDSRDQGAGERMKILAHPEGVWGCTFVGECTRVCPKHVDPAGAIQQYKLSAVLDWAKSLIQPRTNDDGSTHDVSDSGKEQRAA
jgi:fumarate reductase iron-sulfur subunit